MTFTLRPLESADLEWLRILRTSENDNFFTKLDSTPEQQLAWFKSRSYWDERCVILDGETRVGYFSIESLKPDLPIFPCKKPVRYLNSLLVDPAHRGRGVIQAASMALRQEHSYVGYVREGNSASLRACAKLGLLDRGIYEHPEYGRMHIVWRG